LADSGTINDVSESSGVTKTTLYNWFNGKTKRPQFATVAAVLIACGETQLDLKKIRGK
jgi:DNA-binding phage protein